MAHTSRPSPLPGLAQDRSPLISGLIGARPGDLPHRLAGLLQRCWPLPALLAWGLAWSSVLLLQALALPWLGACALATLLGLGLGLLQPQTWRRAIVAAGFPLSALLFGLGELLSAGATGQVPSTVPMFSGAQPMAWLWLLPLAVLALAYPLRTWRDAPFFPTPADALAGLPEVVGLPADAAVIDLGCGAGHGLQALRAAYPQARLHGVEWSWPLRWLAAWRCRWARVQQGDMWAGHWSDYQMVYLFQRPETMARVVGKALAEMRPGSWLVSLEFPAPGLQPHAVLRPRGGRSVWVYRIARLPAADSSPAARHPHTARGRARAIRRIV